MSALGIPPEAIANARTKDTTECDEAVEKVNKFIMIKLNGFMLKKNINKLIN